VNKSTLYNWQLKSLVKNIFTTIVAFALLFGSTGFQVYKHTCAAHNFSAVSLIETPVCEKDHQVVVETDDCCKEVVEEIAEPSCCKAESIDESYPVSIKSKEIECCISSMEGSKLQDIFLTSAEKKNLTLELITGLVPSIEKEIEQTKQNLIIQNTDLPPPKFGKQLLQSIHQLKIDTPIC
jgi:hypothetical protein